MQEPKTVKTPNNERSWLVRVGSHGIVRLALGMLCGVVIAQELEVGKPTQTKVAEADPASVANRQQSTAENPESNPQANQNEKELKGSYDAARQSLGWMTRSLQQMADKLDSISSKLDPNASEEEINREVKRAMREAFADFLPVTSFPSPTIPDNASNASTSNTAKSTDTPPVPIDSPIWNSNTPAWVKDRVLDREVVRVAIESPVESSSEECRTAMDQQMTELVSKVLNNHVLTHAQAQEIRQLTSDYLIGQLVKPDTEYELLLDRPSGTYHQLFRLVHIGPDQLKQIRAWERESVTAKRVQWLGGSAVSALMVLASASGLSGWMAKRSRGNRGSRNP